MVAEMTGWMAGCVMCYILKLEPQKWMIAESVLANFLQGYSKQPEFHPDLIGAVNALESMSMWKEFRSRGLEIFVTLRARFRLLDSVRFPEA